MTNRESNSKAVSRATIAERFACTRNFSKVEVQANAPTCFSNTAHASGPYFSFHSV
jgi:amino acid permease